MPTYKAITKDGKVKTIGEVQVEETSTVEKKTITTLDFIQQHIDNAIAQIADIQKDIDRYATKKVLVMTEAEEVILKT